MVDNLNSEEWHKSNEVFFKSLGDEAQLQALCHMKSMAAVDQERL